MIKSWFKKNWKMCALIMVLIAAIGTLGVVATRPQEPVTETVTLETIVEKTIYVEKEPQLLDYEKLNDATVIIIREHGLTTGVFISEDGYILSCAHSSGEIVGIYIRTYYDDTEMALILRYEGRLVYEWREGDLALYKVDLDRPVPYVNIAADVPRVGEDIFSIGTPLGYPYYISWGKVIDYKYFGFGLGVVEHSSSGNAGNSGGPLFNMKGELIGINVSMIAGLPMMGGYYIPILNGMYAIRLTQVRPMIEAVIEVDRNLQEIVEEFAIMQKHIDELTPVE